MTPALAGMEGEREIEIEIEREREKEKKCAVGFVFFCQVASKSLFYKAAFQFLLLLLGARAR